MTYSIFLFWRITCFYFVLEHVFILTYNMFLFWLTTFIQIVPVTDTRVEKVPLLCSSTPFWVLLHCQIASYPSPLPYILLWTPFIRQGSPVCLARPSQKESACTNDCFVCHQGISGKSALNSLHSTVRPQQSSLNSLHFTMLLGLHMEEVASKINREMKIN